MNHPRILRILALLFFLTIATRPLWAEFQIPEKPDGYVTDRAALLSPASRSRLESQLHEFELQTSNQVVVAIFPGLDGGSLEDISIRIAEKWKIGQKGRDNGVLFLVFRDDRRMRIEVGYGLESVLTDALSAQILRQEVTPQFRLGNYELGILEGVKAICAATQGEYEALPQHEDPNTKVFKILFIFFTATFLIDLIRYSFYFSSHRRYAARYKFWEWFFLFSIFWMMIRSGGRSGGSWSSSGGSGGGFGGGFSGGGGSFGGGGASGRW